LLGVAHGVKEMKVTNVHRPPLAFWTKTNGLRDNRRGPRLVSHATVFIPAKDYYIEKNTFTYYGNIHRILVSDSSNEGAEFGPESPCRGGRLGAHSAHGLVSLE
jgi:hypothetical protein